MGFIASAYRLGRALSTRHSFLGAFYPKFIIRKRPPNNLLSVSCAASCYLARCSFWTIKLIQPRRKKEGKASVHVVIYWAPQFNKLSPRYVREQRANNISYGETHPRRIDRIRRPTEKLKPCPPRGDGITCKNGKRRNM